MELIFNDLSLHGQFLTIDDFEDYYVECLKKILDLIVDRKIPVYKKMDTYSRLITNGVTLEKYLKESSNRTVATLLKKAIIELAFHAPYWDDEKMQSRESVDYQYPNKQDEPNCYTEAIERRCPLLSIQESETEEIVLKCYRNDEQIELENIKNEKNLLDAYLKDDVRNVRFVMEHYPVEKAIRCAEVLGKCYTEEALFENDLEESDIRKFVDNIDMLIQDKAAGRKTHWWDDIRDEINEYRVSVSNGRELRVFFLWREELIFLNGFIKKVRKTPPGEIDKAVDIKKKL